MEFCLEHDKRRKCWNIYNHRDNKPMEEPVRLICLSESRMDALIKGYLISMEIIDDEWLAARGGQNGK